MNVRNAMVGVAAPRALEAQRRIEALNRSQAMIEFEPDGTIVDANDNFLHAMGYSRSQVVGRHHRMFVENDYANSAEYRDFWQRLGAGQFDAGEYLRLNSRGEEVWIQATYNPVFDSQGSVARVVKYAVDITERKHSALEQLEKLEAFGRSQAMIEFAPDGTIVHANDNFLHAMGYSLDEVVGRHHRMFVPPDHALSAEYREFWRQLGAGQFDAGEYLRLNSRGEEVWIQATYNPVFDRHGSVVRVVKLAVDITARKRESLDRLSKIEAIGRSQAMIEFEPDGTIVHANDNFLRAMGYSLQEIAGRHHRIFVDPSYAESGEYRSFWENLRGGSASSGRFQRFARGGREVWIQASYNPVVDVSGRVTRVVKIASDITAEMLRENETRHQASAASEQLASGVTQMTATIEEISNNVRSTDALARDTVRSADAAGAIVKQLDDRSHQIGKVVKLIQKLANQTHLLAINATIEAARAGEAGRSFSVVAGEVQSLADETTQATTTIEESIGAIQKSIEEVVAETDVISKGITDLSTNTTNVATAISQQSATMDYLGKTAEQLRSLSA